jgi:hypothetical protein
MLGQLACFIENSGRVEAVELARGEMRHEPFVARRSAAACIFSGSLLLATSPSSIGSLRSPCCLSSRTWAGSWAMGECGGAMAGRGGICRSRAEGKAPSTTAQQMPQNRCYPRPAMVRVLALLTAGSLLASCAVLQPLGDLALGNTADTLLSRMAKTTSPAKSSGALSAPTQGQNENCPAGVDCVAAVNSRGLY